MASLIFNWKLVEAESRILKKPSEQRERQFSEPLGCLKMWVCLSEARCSRMRVAKCLLSLPLYKLYRIKKSSIFGPLSYLETLLPHRNVFLRIPGNRDDQRGTARMLVTPKRNQLTSNQHKWSCPVSLGIRQKGFDKVAFDNRRSREE